MSETYKLKGLTVQLPIETYDQLKLLSVANRTTMRVIIIDAIEYYSKAPEHKNELKNMHHKIYRLKHDLEDGDK